MRERIGLPRGNNLYGCRHAFGKRLAMAGVELKTLATLMGHTKTTMTEHYIDIANEHEHLRRELEKGNATTKKPEKQP